MFKQKSKPSKEDKNLVYGETTAQEGLTRPRTPEQDVAAKLAQDKAAKEAAIRDLERNLAQHRKNLGSKTTEPEPEPLITGKKRPMSAAEIEAKLKADQEKAIAFDQALKERVRLFDQNKDKPTAEKMSEVGKSVKDLTIDEVLENLQKENFARIAQESEAVLQKATVKEGEKVTLSEAIPSKDMFVLALKKNKETFDIKEYQDVGKRLVSGQQISAREQESLIGGYNKLSALKSLFTEYAQETTGPSDVDTSVIVNEYKKLLESAKVEGIESGIKSIKPWKVLDPKKRFDVFRSKVTAGVLKPIESIDAEALAQKYGESAFTSIQEEERFGRAITSLKHDIAMRPREEAQALEEQLAKKPHPSIKEMTAEEKQAFREAVKFRDPREIEAFKFRAKQRQYLQTEEAYAEELGKMYKQDKTGMTRGMLTRTIESMVVEKRAWYKHHGFDPFGPEANRAAALTSEAIKSNVQVEEGKSTFLEAFRGRPVPRLGIEYGGRSAGEIKAVEEHYERKYGKYGTESIPKQKTFGERLKLLLSPKEEIKTAATPKPVKPVPTIFEDKESSFADRLYLLFKPNEKPAPLDRGAAALEGKGVGKRLKYFFTKKVEEFDPEALKAYETAKAEEKKNQPPSFGKRLEAVLQPKKTVRLDEYRNKSHGLLQRIKVLQGKEPTSRSGKALDEGTFGAKVKYLFTGVVKEKPLVGPPESAPGEEVKPALSFRKKLELLLQPREEKNVYRSKASFAERYATIKDWRSGSAFGPETSPEKTKSAKLRYLFTGKAPLDPTKDITVGYKEGAEELKGKDFGERFRKLFVGEQKKVDKPLVITKYRKGAEALKEKSFGKKLEYLFTGKMKPEPEYKYREGADVLEKQKLGNRIKFLFTGEVDEPDIKLPPKSKSIIHGYAELYEDWISPEKFGPHKPFGPQTAEEAGYVPPPIAEPVPAAEERVPGVNPFDGDVDEPFYEKSLEETTKPKNINPFDETPIPSRRGSISDISLEASQLSVEESAEARNLAKEVVAGLPRDVRSSLQRYARQLESEFKPKSIQAPKYYGEEYEKTFAAMEVLGSRKARSDIRDYYTVLTSKTTGKSQEFFEAADLLTRQEALRYKMPSQFTSEETVGGEEFLARPNFLTEPEDIERFAKFPTTTEQDLLPIERRAVAKAKADIEQSELTLKTQRRLITDPDLRLEAEEGAVKRQDISVFGKQEPGKDLQNRLIQEQASINLMATETIETPPDVKEEIDEVVYSQPSPRQRQAGVTVASGEPEYGRADVARPPEVLRGRSTGMTDFSPSGTRSYTSRVTNMGDLDMTRPGYILPEQRPLATERRAESLIRPRMPARIDVASRLIYRINLSGGAGTEEEKSSAMLAMELAEQRGRASDPRERQAAWGDFEKALERQSKLYGNKQITKINLIGEKGTKEAIAAAKSDLDLAAQAGRQAGIARDRQASAEAMRNFQKSLDKISNLYQQNITESAEALPENETLSALVTEDIGENIKIDKTTVTSDLGLKQKIKNIFIDKIEPLSFDNPAYVEPKSPDVSRRLSIDPFAGDLSVDLTPEELEWIRGDIAGQTKTPEGDLDLTEEEISWLKKEETIGRSQGSRPGTTYVRNKASGEIKEITRGRASALVTDPAAEWEYVSREEATQKPDFGPLKDSRMEPRPTKEPQKPKFDTSEKNFLNKIQNIKLPAASSKLKPMSFVNPAYEGIRTMPKVQPPVAPKIVGTTAELNMEDWIIPTGEEIAEAKEKTGPSAAPVYRDDPRKTDVYKFSEKTRKLYDKYSKIIADMDIAAAKKETPEAVGTKKSFLDRMRGIIPSASRMKSQAKPGPMSFVNPAYEGDITGPLAEEGVATEVKAVPSRTASLSSVSEQLGPKPRGLGDKMRGFFTRGGKVSSTGDFIELASIGSSSEKELLWDETYDFGVPGRRSRTSSLGSMGELSTFVGQDRLPSLDSKGVSTAKLPVRTEDIEMEIMGDKRSGLLSRIKDVLTTPSKTRTAPYTPLQQEGESSIDIKKWLAGGTGFEEGGEEIPMQRLAGSESGQRLASESMESISLGSERATSETALPGLAQKTSLLQRISDAIKGMGQTARGGLSAGKGAATGIVSEVTGLLPGRSGSYDLMSDSVDSLDSESLGSDAGLLSGMTKKVGGLQMPRLNLPSMPSMRWPSFGGLGQSGSYDVTQPQYVPLTNIVPSRGSSISGGSTLGSGVAETSFMGQRTGVTPLTSRPGTPSSGAMPRPTGTPIASVQSTVKPTVASSVAPKTTGSNAVNTFTGVASGLTAAGTIAGTVLGGLSLSLMQESVALQKEMAGRPVAPPVEDKEWERDWLRDEETGKINFII